jgi:hypothetical protein
MSVFLIPELEGNFKPSAIEVKIVEVHQTCPDPSCEEISHLSEIAVAVTMTPPGEGAPWTHVFDIEEARKFEASFSKAVRHALIGSVALHTSGEGDA